MVRPTPKTEGTQTQGVEGPASPRADGGSATRLSATVSDAATRAHEFLEMLGRSDHPDAERDPLYALYQVAVDFQCSAHGYRELYLRKRPAKG